ncbi:MAG: hypothetical protein WBG50_25220 [Desulfomonilaceae bacterium]
MLTTPPDRAVYDRFTPKSAGIQSLAKEMLRFKSVDSSDVSGLVEDTFANLDGITDIKSIIDVPDR